MTNTPSRTAKSLHQIPLGLEQADAREAYAIIEALVSDVTNLPRSKEIALSRLADLSALFGPEGQATFEEVLDVIGVDREMNVTRPELYARREGEPIAAARVLEMANRFKGFIDDAMRNKR